MKKLFSLLVLAVVATTFMHCNGDDEPGASMSITVDGTAIKVVSPSGVLAFDTEHGHEGRGLLIVGEADGNQLTVSVSNWDFQNPPENAVLAKEYYNVFEDEYLENTECLDVDEFTKLCEGGLITYTVGDEVFYSAFDDSMEAFITITKCDGKRVSGEFKVKMVSFEENELELTGTFSNVRYMVI